MSAPGDYAEYIAWSASCLYALPDDLDYETGTLVKPLSIAVHAVGLAHIRPYDSVFIVGAGPIGHRTLSVLKRTSINQIAVSDTSDVRLEVARSIGAQVTINPLHQNPREVIDRFTDGGGVDVAFEAVGLSATAQQTLDVLETRTQSSGSATTNV